MRAAGRYCLRRGAQHQAAAAARPCPAQRSGAGRAAPTAPAAHGPQLIRARLPAAPRAPARRAERPCRRPPPPPPPLPPRSAAPEPSAASAGGDGGGGGGLGAPSPLRARRGEDAWGGDGFSPVAPRAPPLPSAPSRLPAGAARPRSPRGAVARLPPARRCPHGGQAEHGDPFAGPLPGGVDG